MKNKKPLIRFFGCICGDPIWVCTNGFIVWYGPTPKSAFAGWLYMKQGEA